MAATTVSLIWSCRWEAARLTTFAAPHRDPRMLSAALKRIERFSHERLGLKLNPSKTIIQPIDRGVDFVGRIVKPHNTTVRRRTVSRAVHRVESTRCRQTRRDVLNSYLGLMRHGKNYQKSRKLAKVARLLNHSHSYSSEKVFA